MTGTQAELDALLDGLFGSIPLPFVREFLRERKQNAKAIRIGRTTGEVRSNLRDSVLAKHIGINEIRRWLNDIEGWGRQHLYIQRFPKRSLAHPNLLTEVSLTRFLENRRLRDGLGGNEDRGHKLSKIAVDDELARLVWVLQSTGHERREDLDEVREIEDDEFEFRAFRRIPKRSASQLIVRKADGIVLTLVDLPLGEDHHTVRAEIERVAATILAPLRLTSIPLGPIVSSLDSGAVAKFGPRATRGVELEVAPTQARYRTDGAQVEFTSTRQSTGYTAAAPARHVRKALEISKFEGEAGKFRLTFEGSNKEPHDMVVSLQAIEGRLFLYSRMTEQEVLSLVDQLLAVTK